MNEARAEMSIKQTPLAKPSAMLPTPSFEPRSKNRNFTHASFNISFEKYLHNTCFLSWKAPSGAHIRVAKFLSVFLNTVTFELWHRKRFNFFPNFNSLRKFIQKPDCDNVFHLLKEENYNRPQLTTEKNKRVVFVGGGGIHFMQPLERCTYISIV